MLTQTETQYDANGNPSTAAADSEKYTYNALGEVTTRTDRNGSVHAYSYDVLGRLTADAVTTLASGVDGAIRRIETAYDTAGRPFRFTSYDAPSGGNVVNQVERVYNGLGQLITEYQAHAGAVDPATTPKVQYGYSEMAGGANHSRLTSLTYPNGRVLNYNYSAGLDDRISRLSSLFDNSATLESYDYLGLATVVRRAHPQPSVDLTYIKQAGEADGDAGDPYTGLDRFGRVVDQRWRKGDGSHTDRFAYGYDRNNNRLYRQNLIDAAFSELYHANGASEGYDLLNQLTAFRRGVLSDSNSDGIPDTVASASRSQEWDFDALGNWSTLTTDGTPESRSHNRQNQITAISGQTTPAYDNNGNLTTDPTGKTLVYDAWNRLVKVKDGATTLVTYSHDALSRRVTEDRSGTVTDLYYSAAWQVLEERVGGTAKIQYVWSPVYVDALVLRD
ncbi:MAG TPA: RHS repeat domain-containing protein, partial [Gemmataceae bacterium]|nr:RHS repeat domain-containing protein [Gemmataceae bacterium]